MAPVPVQPGSLIIPMDITYQDAGMFQAYGLVYFLLQSGIPVIWSIAPDKPWGGPDFTASAVDIQSLAPVTAHAYLGGPFIISADHAAAAEPLIQAWQVGHTTTVHRVTVPFTAPEYARLRHAPRIAVGQSSAAIVSGYLNAAGIPDSTGNPWTLSSPDVLSPAKIAAGVLFANPTQACTNRAYDFFLAPQTSAAPAVVANLDKWVRLGGYLHGTCFPVSTTENQFLFLTAAGIPGPFNQGVPGTFTVNVADFGLTQALNTTDLQDLPTGGSDKSWRRGTVSYLPYAQPMAHFHAESGPQYDFMAFGPYKGGTGAGSVSYEGGCEYDVTNLPYSTNPETPYLRFVYNALLLSVARPQLAFAFSPDEAAVGYPTTFTVTIQNDYGQTASGLSVAVTPAPGVTWAGNETLPPTLSGPPTWTWVIPAFAPADAFSFQLTATPAAPGQLPLFTVAAGYAAPEGAHYQLQTCAGVIARFDRPPTVTITNPLTGAIVSGVCPVTWTGSDPDGDPLTYDLFLSLDGGATWSTLATGLTVTSFNWDTDSLNSTNAHIRVVASDGLLTGQDEQGPFTVDNTPPTVQILTPAANSTICGTVELTAEAFDAVGVASVSYSFSIDGGSTWQAIGTASGGPPWSVLFDTIPVLALGGLYLRAIATDLAGLTGEQTIYLYYDNWPPEAAITAPPDSSLLSGSVLLQGTADDPMGLGRVEWRIDGALVATQTAAPFQYLWNTTLAANGPHEVTLTAIDKCPNTTVATAHYTVENAAVECLTEVGVDGEILIPSGKPPAERLLEPAVRVEVTVAYVIDTPLGAKAVVTGVVRLLLRYVAALPEQPVHAVEREIPWRTFLLCPGLEPGAVITATVTIESTHLALLDHRRIDKFLLLLVQVAPA